MLFQWVFIFTFQFDWKNSLEKLKFGKWLFPEKRKTWKNPKRSLGNQPIYILLFTLTNELSQDVGSIIVLLTSQSNWVHCHWIFRKLSEIPDHFSGANIIQNCLNNLKTLNSRFVPMGIIYVTLETFELSETSSECKIGNWHEHGELPNLPSIFKLHPYSGLVLWVTRSFP